jgi:NAD(P)-dependent dehydrogenase (short-subunit alcohol dehydrogenase family)
MPAPGRRVILITGASSGIGQACAERLAHRGDCVYGTSRRASLAMENVPGQPILLPMDVTDQASVDDAVATIMEREGRIDALINNAGFGLAGPVETTVIADAQRQFDANFFGVLRVCRAVLPILRVQRSGYVLNISSIGGQIAIPFQSMYSASKFALEGLTESLRYEVAGFGIRAVLIAPGDHRTGFTAHRQRSATDNPSAPYAAACNTAISRMERDEQAGPPAENVAALVERILSTSHPRLRYTVGQPTQRAAVWMKRLLPFAWIESGVRRYYGLSGRPQR